jgi:hypothetical protein
MYRRQHRAGNSTSSNFRISSGKSASASSSLILKYLKKNHQLTCMSQLKDKESAREQHGQNNTARHSAAPCHVLHEVCSKVHVVAPQPHPQTGLAIVCGDFIAENV